MCVNWKRALTVWEVMAPDPRPGEGPADHNSPVSPGNRDRSPRAGLAWLLAVRTLYSSRSRKSGTNYSVF